MALFPIGELLKSDVRSIAEKAGLHTADKKDSQGLCFVGKISLPQFLQQKLSPLRGDIVEIPATLPTFKAYDRIPVQQEYIEQLAAPFSYTPDQGEVVTQHQGAHYYTIGQRKGLHIGGRPNPSFVIDTDVTTNTVYSGQNDDHPGLNRWALKIKQEDMHFVSSRFTSDLLNNKEIDVRIRYRQALQKCTVHNIAGDTFVLFKEKQRGITPGQFAAFYIDKELIASGVILH
jgi:tRNA-specific 2-thiouridylase